MSPFTAKSITTTKHDSLPGFDRTYVLDPPDITAGFKHLILNDSNQAEGQPTGIECTAHLKLLECFYRLRQNIGSRNDLYNISNGLVLDAALGEDEQTPELMAKLAEKRWAVYVHQAVERFEIWSASALPTAQMLDLKTYDNERGWDKIIDMHENGVTPLHLSHANMPPIDVLMVWHAYRLNPRVYLEDCLRKGQMSFWHTKFPWQTISDSINADSFVYAPGHGSEQQFTSYTGLPWNSLDQTVGKHIVCATCGQLLTAMWTTVDRTPINGRVETQAAASNKRSAPLSAAHALDKRLTEGYGFCDLGFEMTCTRCSAKIDHESLRVDKFCKDVQNLVAARIPMNGTLLAKDGLPRRSSLMRIRFRDDCNYPNDLLRGMGSLILQKRDHNNKPIELRTMSDVRAVIEAAIKSASYRRSVNKSMSSAISPGKKWAIRKMMSRYWDNSSPFGLDLVGAVVRQGIFVEKMHNIDWLHSPALSNTTRRLCVKYTRFMGIIADAYGRMAVPTLDVDLAWHTHQLAAPGYLAYTVRLTKQFIDHDDKVSEVTLNDAFARTSVAYHRLYNEPYSECTCWYCEAIRESVTSAASRLFGGTNARIRKQLHDSPQNPLKSVHISAHNAVRPSDSSDYTRRSREHAAKLDTAYANACARARKSGRPEPKREDYYYSDAYGYPVWIPAYSPYTGYVPYAPLYYPATPGCMALGSGSGNCCAGTCGGAVAAGGCIASGPTCGGGMIGGACGGGGGGGSSCGGGGGGCGGGGGGCGGGGGGC